MKMNKIYLIGTMIALILTIQVIFYYLGNIACESKHIKLANEQLLKSQKVKSMSTQINNNIESKVINDINKNETIAKRQTKRIYKYVVTHKQSCFVESEARNIGNKNRS